MKKLFLNTAKISNWVSFTNILLLLLFCNGVSAQNLSYTTSWLGNSIATNKLYVQEEIHNIWVSRDGISYSNTWYDETSRRVVAYNSNGTVTQSYLSNTVGGGEEIGGNSTAVFVSTQNTSLARLLRSDGSQTAIVVVPGTAVLGVAANETEVFVSSLNGSVYVYNASTLVPVRNFNVGGSGRIALDGAGFLWAITGSTTLKRYSSTGVLQSQSITLPPGNIAAAVTVNANNNTLYVIDRGTDQNIKVYNTVTTTPVRTADFGVTGGIFSGARPGLVGPLRFSFNSINDTDIPDHTFGLCGVALDNSGNIYVLHGRLSGSHIEKYNSSGVMQWHLIGHTFEEAAYIDPTTDESDVYAGAHHYKMNYAASSDTEMASWYGYGASIDEANAYYEIDQDRGITFQGISPIRIANIAGSKFIWMTAQTGGVYVYRMPANSETLVNCGITDADPSIVWPRGSIQDVDANGTMWSGDNLTIIEKYPCTGVSNSKPVYNLNSPLTYPMPAPYSNVYVRVKYIAETDVMYIIGQTNGISGSKVSRYNNWSTSRTLVFTVDMYNSQIKIDVQSLSVAGDYIFTDYFANSPVPGSPGYGLVKVWNANTGAFVMDMQTPANYNAGDADNKSNTQAFKRANGEYIITFLDHYNVKTVIFRWIPGNLTATLTTTGASAVTSTTATSGGFVSSDGGPNVTARGVCWSTTISPTTANSKTIDGSGIGTFTSSITGLTSGTLYHVRAYATNSSGTSYGSDLTFNTQSSAGGSWTIADDAAPGWTWVGFTNDPCATCYNGTAHSINARNKTAQYSFTGTNVEAYCETFSGAGSVKIYIDGIIMGTYSQDVSPYGGAQKFATVTGLSNATHTIKFTTTSTNWVGIDYIRFAVNPSPGSRVANALPAVKSANDIFSANTVEIYPNPAERYTTIKLKATPKNEPAIIEVTDLSGRRVFSSGKLGGVSFYKLNTGNYAAGTYIISVMQGKEKTNHKLVIK